MNTQLETLSPPLVSLPTSSKPKSHFKSPPASGRRVAVRADAGGLLLPTSVLPLLLWSSGPLPSCSWFWASVFVLSQPLLPKSVCRRRRLWLFLDVWRGGVQQRLSAESDFWVRAYIVFPLFRSISFSFQARVRYCRDLSPVGFVVRHGVSL